MKVFVYGTLKTGYGNNRLLSECTLCGVYRVSDFKLYFSGQGYGFPVACPSDGDVVLGEVWEVLDASVLARLDRLESNGFMYNRTSVRVEGIDEPVYLYVGNDHFWDFSQMVECPKNDTEEYYWG